MGRQTVGIDIDGVIANFQVAYQRLFVETTGRDTFLPGDDENPPSWHWPTDRGYTEEETSKVWEIIKADPHFWRSLAWIPENIEPLRRSIRTLMREHDLYFITNRMGVDAKPQTEAWLRGALGILYHPTTLLVQHRAKGLAAKALGLACYIDDNYDNAVDVIRESGQTRTYLLDRNYNRKPTAAQYDGIPAIYRLLEDRRIPNLSAFLHAEGLVP